MGYGGYLVKFGNYTIPNNLIKQDTFSSVSYTHLDVYKRQEQGIENAQATSGAELKEILIEKFNL